MFKIKSKNYRERKKEKEKKQEFQRLTFVLTHEQSSQAT